MQDRNRHPARPRRAVAASLGATFVLVCALAIAPGAALARPFKPFDEGPRDKRFAAFRAQLIRIADARDLEALRRHFDRNIRTSFGGDAGAPAAVKTMRESPERWRILARILRRGGKFDRRKVACRPAVAGKTCTEVGFIAPYTYWAEPLKGRDAYETVVITGERVNVRAAPSHTAKAVERISHRIVSLPKKAAPDTPKSWLEIETPGGRRGFVERRFTVSPIDYRVGFVRDGGAWKMTFFLAGD